MKHSIMKHVYLGSMAGRDDEFVREVSDVRTLRPTRIRWFCGTQDLDLQFRPM